MAITRVTHNMLSQRSLSTLQLGLGRLARTQQQISSGKVLARPSDSPVDTVSAMRVRSSLADQKQYVRNGEDAQAWLEQTDSTLSSMIDQAQRCRDLALQGANTGAVNANAREALAAEVDQLRSSLLAQANTTHLGRPIFGGVTALETAYDAAGAFRGTAGAVSRVIGDGSKIEANVNGPDVFGVDGRNLFDELTQLSAAIRSSDATVVRSELADLDKVLDGMITAQTDVGAKEARVERALQTANDAILSLTTSLSDLEDVDLPKATIDLQVQEAAYQAALATTARVMQPSLLDFLR